MKKSKHTPETLISEMEKEGPKLNKSLHETLGKDAIPALSGIMGSNAERLYPIPKRFKVSDGSRGSCRTITDTHTGTSIEVGLCDYFGARQAIQAFFNEEI